MIDRKDQSCLLSLRENADQLALQVDLDVCLIL
jgi:hypothetical protein